MRTLLLILLLSTLVTGCNEQVQPNPIDKRLSGGATTVFDQSANAYSLPAANLSITRRDNFFIGNAFFKQPWITAPASTTSRDGLGPLFNTNSCQGCHIKDGRGHPPINDETSFISALVRISVPASNSPADTLTMRQHGGVPDPAYGGQIQSRAVRGVAAEAQPALTYETVTGEFPDGETYSLLQPILSLGDPAYGEFHPDLQTSVRVAQPMIGLGLLEAIPIADLLALADADDRNGDGISGRANKVWDIQQQQTVLGRFGWKASQPTVEQQSLVAFANDIGITSNMLPDSICTATQRGCISAPHGGLPEIESEIAEKVVFYARLLAVPARRSVDDKAVQEGEKLFENIQCSACHVPAFTTGTLDGFPELEQQQIQPFTDLLLHDMGAGLADSRADFEATGTEWRTAPLWGIGLVETVNGHTRLLHDGRARNLQEAILWHAGEAEASKNEFMALRKSERNALLTFLESL